MSFPYIIWTMQRTGGTTLAALFANLSEHPRVQHEPFNQERAYGRVLNKWNAHRDPDQLRADIRDVLQPRPVIKHCHELLPAPLNAALMAVSSELGYRHIVLERRAEVDRVLSLEMAKTNGVWGKAEAWRVHQEFVDGTTEPQPLNIARALSHMQMCQDRKVALAELFAAHGQTPYTMVFEDIYTDPAVGRRAIHELVKFLKIDVTPHKDYAQQVNEALLQKGQNSARIAAFIPNYEQARNALSAALDTQTATPPLS